MCYIWISKCSYKMTQKSKKLSLSKYEAAASRTCLCTEKALL